MKVLFNHEKGYVWIRLYGKQTLETLQQAYYKLLEMPEYRVGMRRVWDIRQADLSQMTANELRRLGTTSRDPESGTGKTKVAVLVGRDVEYGVMRMLQALGGETMPVTVAVFRSAEETEEWISTPFT